MVDFFQRTHHYIFRLTIRLSVPFASPFLLSQRSLPRQSGRIDANFRVLSRRTRRLSQHSLITGVHNGYLRSKHAFSSMFLHDCRFLNFLCLAEMEMLGCACFLKRQRSGRITSLSMSLFRGRGIRYRRRIGGMGWSSDDCTVHCCLFPSHPYSSSFRTLFFMLGRDNVLRAGQGRDEKQQSRGRRLNDMVTLRPHTK